MLIGLVTIQRRTDGGLAFAFITSGSPAGETAVGLQFATFGAAVLEWYARAPKGGPVPFEMPTYEVVPTKSATNEGTTLDPQTAASRSVLTRS